MQKRFVVVINAVAESGKSSFVNFLLDSEYKCVKNIYEISTIDLITNFAITLGWDGIKNEKSRKFLSDVKMLVSEFNDGTFKYVTKYCDSVFSHAADTNSSVVVFVHCREPKEIQKIKDYYKDECKTLLMLRDCKLENVPNNDGDRSVFAYKYDYTIENNGTLLDLKEKAKEFILKLFP